jgi:hypothetical protein
MAPCPRVSRHCEERSDEAIQDRKHRACCPGLLRFARNDAWARAPAFAGAGSEVRAAGAPRRVETRIRYCTGAALVAPRFSAASACAIATGALLQMVLSFTLGALVEVTPIANSPPVSVPG